MALTLARSILSWHKAYIYSCIQMKGDRYLASSVSF